MPLDTSRREHTITIVPEIFSVVTSKLTIPPAARDARHFVRRAQLVEFALDGGLEVGAVVLTLENSAHVERLQLVREAARAAAHHRSTLVPDRQI